MKQTVGWREVLPKIRREAFSDYLLTAAAGVAFHGFFGLLPALAAVATLWRLMVGSASIAELAEGLPERLPGGAGDVVAELLVEIPRGFGLGLNLAVNLAVVVWTAQRAASGLVAALNLAYDETERRTMLRRSLVALVIAISGMGFLLVTLAILIAGTVIAEALQGPAAAAIRWGRWPLLAIATVGALSLLYAFAPARSGKRWRWVGRGASVGTILWLLGSVALVLYVDNVGAYGHYYGSIGAAVVLLLWFYIGAVAVLVGAEVNAAFAEACEHRKPSETKQQLRDRERRREDQN